MVTFRTSNRYHKMGPANVFKVESDDPEIFLIAFIPIPRTDACWRFVLKNGSEAIGFSSISVTDRAKKSPTRADGEKVWDIETIFYPVQEIDHELNRMVSFTNISQFRDFDHQEQVIELFCQAMQKFNGNKDDPNPQSHVEFTEIAKQNLKSGRYIDD